MPSKKEGREYLCGCGHKFPEKLGKYGCPACCGDEGPALLTPVRDDRRQGDRLIELIKLRRMTVATMIEQGISRYPVKRIKECLPDDMVLRMELDPDGDSEIIYWVEPKPKPTPFLDTVNDIARRIAELVRRGLA